MLPGARGPKHDEGDGGDDDDDGDDGGLHEPDTLLQIVTS